MTQTHLSELINIEDAGEFLRSAPDRERELVQDFAVMLSIVGIVAAVLVSILTAAISSAAPVWFVLPLALAFGVACVIALAIGNMLVRVRKLTEHVLEQWALTLETAREQWALNQETAREVAKIQATQQTNVSVRGRQNVVSVNSQGQAVESVRLVGLNVNRPARLIDGVDERDLAYFCDRVVLVGHSKRAWLGQQLPSGKLVSTFEDYNQLVAPMVKAGLIAGRGERSSGALVTTDARALRGALGLPGGAQDQNQIAQIEQGEVKEVN